MQVGEPPSRFLHILPTSSRPLPAPPASSGCSSCSRSRSTLTWCSRAVNRNFPSFFAACRTRSSPLGPLLPARCPVRVRLFRVLLGQRPSLHNLLAALPGLRSTASSVLCRCTTPRCRASGSYSSSPSPSVPCPTGHGRPRGLSVLAREVSMHAWGLRLRPSRSGLRSPFPTRPICFSTFRFSECLTSV
jgi:hypothetical protein